MARNLHDVAAACNTCACNGIQARAAFAYERVKDLSDNEKLMRRGG
jgi:hypothetical protein